MAAWFKKARKPLASSTAEKPSRVPEGLMVKCPDCGQVIYNKDLEKNLAVCPKCAYHFRIGATERLTSLFDNGRWTEHFPELTSNDPLKFTDTKPYRERLRSSIKTTGLNDAVIVATGVLDGLDVVVAAMEYSFIGGSMGVVVGEKITRAIEIAIDRRQPMIIISCSGGARMMEGALSLMQMAKVSAALARLDRASLPYISVLTDPTTGGVTASFAMLGDLNIAEPKALIGFAGPRVIEQTIRQKLPEGFQRSEFLVDHGMIDLVVDRRELKTTLARALRFMRARSAVVEAPELAVAGAVEPGASELTAVDRLFALETFGIKLGLANITHLCAALGHPERTFTSVHVAGTNGKGSVTAMIHAALVAEGVRAARYTSPHLVDLAERFVIGFDPVDAPTLERAAQDLLECSDKLRAEGILQAHPTFFEATTALGFELFRRAHVEVAVVEVGLGGRFDATNVLSPPVGVITSIGLDHQQYLGETLDAIAFEKAGIVKPGMTLVAGALPPPAIATVRRIVSERGAHLIEAADDVELDSVMDEGRAVVTIKTPIGKYGPVPLGLRGEHQVHNALVAVRAIEALRHQGWVVSTESVESGLSAPEWPGRLELVALPGGKRVLLDGAHNIDGARALAAYLKRWHPERPTLVVGMMRDKDVDGILDELLAVTSSVIATAADTRRALPAAELAERIAARRAALAPARSEQLRIHAEPDPLIAVDEALSRGDTACVAGSIFLVGAVRDTLKRRAILR